MACEDGFVDGSYDNGRGVCDLLQRRLFPAVAPAVFFDGFGWGFLDLGHHFCCVLFGVTVAAVAVGVYFFRHGEEPGI